MITAEQIGRMVRAEAFPRLIDRVISNGRDGARDIRRRLAEPGSAVAAGLGLGLQRLCEISYGPSPLAALLAERLMQQQREDGLFASRRRLAATAVALRGLLEWQGMRRSCGHVEDTLLQTAIARGLRALERALGQPDVDGADAEYAIGPADARQPEIILWQLGGHRAFREAAAARGLVARLSRPQSQADALSRLALAAAA